MPSTVYFAPSKVKRLSADDSLPAKFKRLLERVDLKPMCHDRRVAIKMHVGGNMGYSTIHPLFVRMVVTAVKEAGGSPFITDGSFSVAGAVHRGYTQEVLGAPILPVGGATDKYFYPRPVGYRSLEKVHVAGNIADADAMIVLSHGKGHGQCGFGGAIKNIAMGCVTTQTRGWIHALMDTEFKWDRERCNHCYVCQENCPGSAISFDKSGDWHAFPHHCRYCMHCVDSCPADAITISLDGIRYFQEGMARATKAVLDSFGSPTAATPDSARVLYLTALLHITPLCDCWGYTTPAIVPDIGIMGSHDIVAIEQASLDSIKSENYIPGSLPEQVKMSEGDGHLLQRIWAKDPYLQVATAAALGLGNREYELVEVE